jgi:hypothetical protein
MSDFLSGARAGLGLYSGYQSARAQARAKYGAELEEAQSQLGVDFKHLDDEFFNHETGEYDPDRLAANPELAGSLAKAILNNKHFANRVLPKGYKIEAAIPVDDNDRFAIALRNEGTGEIAPLSTKGAKSGDDVVVHDFASIASTLNEARRFAHRDSSLFKKTVDVGYPAAETADGDVPPYADPNNPETGPLIAAFRRATPGIPVDVQPSVTGSKAPAEPAALGQSVDYGAFQKKMAASESSGDYGKEFKDNKGRRFVGKYQIGQQRLTDGVRAGVVPEGTTLDELKSSKDLQDTLAAWHFRDYGDRLVKEGISGNAKHPVTGEPLSDEALIAAAQIGGWSGMKKWLAGGYDPEDQFGTSISDYAAKFNVPRAIPGMASSAGLGADGVLRLRGDEPSGTYLGLDDIERMRQERMAADFEERPLGELPGKAIGAVGDFIKKKVFRTDRYGLAGGGSSYNGASTSADNKGQGSKFDLSNVTAADAAKVDPQSPEGQRLAAGVEQQVQDYAKNPPRPTTGAVIAANKPNPTMKSVTRMAGYFIDYGWATPQQALSMVQNTMALEATIASTNAKSYASAAKDNTAAMKDQEELLKGQREQLADMIGENVESFAAWDDNLKQYVSVKNGRPMGKDVNAVRGQILSLIRANLANPGALGLAEKEAAALRDIFMTPGRTVKPSDQVILNKAMYSAFNHLQENRIINRGEGEGKTVHEKGMSAPAAKVFGADGTEIGTVEELSEAWVKQFNKVPTADDIARYAEQQGYIIR